MDLVQTLSLLALLGSYSFPPTGVWCQPVSASELGHLETPTTKEEQIGRCVFHYVKQNGILYRLIPFFMTCFKHECNARGTPIATTVHCMAGGGDDHNPETWSGIEPLEFSLSQVW